ncbi:hypothetical protein [Streptomyces sp. NPDC056144]|uniref:hypothetical protein n=1 Tax=unclassified Streptomyces TaxID=2593676 RepID=UPI0035DEAB41
MTPRRAPNDRLRSLLREAQWTQEACARAVNAVGVEVAVRLAYDRTAVAHWLAGTQPHEPVPRLLAEAFTRRIGRAVTREELGFAQAAAPEPADSLLAAVGADASVPPYRVPTPAPRWRELAERRAVADGRGAPPRVGSSEAELLGDAVRHFARAMATHGGAHGRRALSVYLSDTAASWLRAPADEEIRRGLRRETAHLALVLGLMHADMGEHGRAQRSFATSATLAREAGDKTAWAIGLRAQSAQALALGHRAAARECALAAVDATADRSPGAVRAYTLSQLGVVQAALKDERAALRTLDEAEQALGDGDGDGDGERASDGGAGESPFRSYPESALAFQSAETLRLLDRPALALRALNRSVRARVPHERRAVALTLARQAELLFACGRLDEACAAWGQFVQAREGLRSRTVTDASRAMRAALAPYARHPAVRRLSLVRPMAEM